MHILNESFKKKGNGGIRILFSESVNGKLRVTINKKIIDRVCQVLTENI